MKSNARKSKSELTYQYLNLEKFSPRLFEECFTGGHVKKQIINNIFRIIGAAAAAANLLCEFKIAEKKDARLIKNKKGNVILVRSIAIFNFSVSFENPGAINLIKAGMNISIIKIVKNNPNNNKLKIVFANEFAFFFPLVSAEE